MNVRGLKGKNACQQQNPDDWDEKKQLNAVQTADAECCESEENVAGSLSVLVRFDKKRQQTM